MWASGNFKNNWKDPNPFFFFLWEPLNTGEIYDIFFFFKKYKKYLLRKWLIRVYSHFEISDTLNGADI